MKEKIYLETSVISAYFDFREQFPDKKLETRKFWHMDFLVSWNQRHITRPHRRKIIREFNERYKLFIPEITTPEEMLGEV